MSVNTSRESAIRALLFDRPIAYHPIIAKAVGSVTAGVLLSQFLYWTPRTSDPEGWFYKTQDDIYNETALTRWEQETARRHLRGSKVLEERKAGVPARLYFRVSLDALEALLEGPGCPQDASQDVGIPHTRMMDSDTQVSGNPPYKDGGIHQPIKGNSETTTEITQERSRHKSQRSAPGDLAGKYSDLVNR